MGRGRLCRTPRKGGPKRVTLRIVVRTHYRGPFGSFLPRSLGGLGLSPTTEKEERWRTVLSGKVLSFTLSTLAHPDSFIFSLVRVPSWGKGGVRRLRLGTKTKVGRPLPSGFGV